VTYVPADFTITAFPITTDTSFTVSQPEDVVYNGASQKQLVDVHDIKTNNNLVLDTDYTLAYSDDTKNVGTVTVTVTGIGNYSGTVYRTYKITPATLIVVTPDASKTWDGTALTAAGTITGFVKDEGVELNTTGKQTDVGSSLNTYEIPWNETTKASNYTINETIGTLTVNRGATPGTPDNPTDPTRPTTPTTNGRPHTPNTGDQTNAPLAAGTLGFSILLAGFVLFFKKKYSD
jgi:LPXTG-motif cell wall-anchored protein